jgi:hypothetical protein
MKKLIVVLALVGSASTVVLAVGKEKSSRKARREAAKKEMKCCNKEFDKECKKESKSYYEKKSEQ